MTEAIKPNKTFFSACNLVQISMMRLAPPALNGQTEDKPEIKEGKR